jgi:hypothetical protein
MKNGRSRTRQARLKSQERYEAHFQGGRNPDGSIAGFTRLAEDLSLVTFSPAKACIQCSASAPRMSNKRAMELILSQLLPHLLAMHMRHLLKPNAHKLLEHFIEQI